MDHSVQQQQQHHEQHSEEHQQQQHQQQQLLEQQQHEHEHKHDVSDHRPVAAASPLPQGDEGCGGGAVAEEVEGIQSQEATSTDSVDGKGNKRNNHGRKEAFDREISLENLTFSFKWR